MQATNLISVEEYSRMTFEHDAEYVCGRSVYRPVPQFPHARLQATLSSYFCGREREWGLITVTEQPVRIAAEVCRIPAICLLREAPETGIVTRTTTGARGAVTYPDLTQRKIVAVGTGKEKR